MQGIKKRVIDGQRRRHMPKTCPNALPRLPNVHGALLRRLAHNKRVRHVTRRNGCLLFDMTGQVAIITGSSRGIGKAIALEMAAQGAKVVISSRKAEACDATAAEINMQFGAGTAIAVPARSRQRTISRIWSMTPAVHSEKSPR